MYGFFILFFIKTLLCSYDFAALKLDYYLCCLLFLKELCLIGVIRTFMWEQLNHLCYATVHCQCCISHSLLWQHMWLMSTLFWFAYDFWMDKYFAFCLGNSQHKSFVKVSSNFLLYYIKSYNMFILSQWD